MRVMALVLLVLCSSMTMADITQISDDTFVIRRTDKGGIFGNTAKMRDKVLREADEFATAKRKIAETVTLSETAKHQKAFMVDLKRVYRAVSKDAAESALDNLEERWGQKYPIVIKSWRNKWDNLSVYFKYPEEIRRVIYTTNSIEAVHRQFRKLTKTKGGFPNENSLLKLLYLGIQNASKKWTMPIRNWNLALSQLAIFFEGRLDEALEL